MRGDQFSACAHPYLSPLLCTSVWIRGGNFKFLFSVCNKPKFFILPKHGKPWCIPRTVTSQDQILVWRGKKPSTNATVDQSRFLKNIWMKWWTEACYKPQTEALNSLQHTKEEWDRRKPQAQSSHHLMCKSINHSFAFCQTQVTGYSPHLFKFF